MQPYRGARVKRRQQIINGILIVAILAALAWVIYLLVLGKLNGMQKPDPVPPTASSGEQVTEPAPDPEPVVVPNGRTVMVTSQDMVQPGVAEQLLALAMLDKIDRVAVVLKTPEGELGYPSQIVEIQNTKLLQEQRMALPSALQKLRGEKMQIPLVAVVYAQEDTLYPTVNAAAGLLGTNGKVWHDNTRAARLDPASDAANTYLASIAREAAALGFDEILLRGLGYPTTGRLDRVAYPEDKPKEVTEAVAAIRTAVPQTRVSIWLDTPFILNNEQSGQNVVDLYKLADCVYATPEEQTEQGLLALKDQIRTLTGDSEKLNPVLTDAEAFNAASGAVLYDGLLGSLL